MIGSLLAVSIDNRIVKTQKWINREWKIKTLKFTSINIYQNENKGPYK